MTIRITLPMEKGMFTPAARKTVVVFSAVALLSAGGAAVWFSDLTPISRGNPESLLSILRDRSPGQRAAGASSGKRAMLSESIPAAKLKPTKAPSPLAPLVMDVSPATTPAVSGLAAPLPFAIAPITVPAFAPAAAGFPMVFPPLLLPGGDDDFSSVVVNPPGAGPSPVPGVPEPGTWVMMIIGFGLIGGILRRRRRLTAVMEIRARRLGGPGSISLASTSAL